MFLYNIVFFQPVETYFLKEKDKLCRPYFSVPVLKNQFPT